MKEIGKNTAVNIFDESNNNQKLLDIHKEVQVGKRGLERIISAKELSIELISLFLNSNSDTYMVTTGEDLTPEKGKEEEEEDTNSGGLYSDFKLFLQNNDKDTVVNQYREIIKKHMEGDYTATDFLKTISGFYSGESYYNLSDKSFFTKTDSEILKEMEQLTVLEDIEKYFENIVTIANEYVKIDNKKSLELIIEQAKTFEEGTLEEYLSVIDYMNSKFSEMIDKNKYSIMVKNGLRIYNAYGDLDNMRSISEEVKAEAMYLDMMDFSMITSQIMSVTTMANKAIRKRIEAEFKAVIDNIYNQKTAKAIHDYAYSDDFQQTLLIPQEYFKFDNTNFIIEQKSEYPILESMPEEELNKLNDDFNNAETWKEKADILIKIGYKDFPFSLIDK